MRLTLGTTWAALFVAAALSGCNTVSGMGEDLSAAGRGIDQTSETTQDKMTGHERTEEQRQRESESDTQSGRY